MCQEGTWIAGTATSGSVGGYGWRPGHFSSLLASWGFSSEDADRRN